MEKVRIDAERAAQPEGCQHRLHDGGRFEANAQYTGLQFRSRVPQ